MTIEGPNNFESLEKTPVSKEDVVALIREKGWDNPEALGLLEKFTAEKEVQFQQEGREDARLESLREKAHALNLADCFAPAIEVMHTVAEISDNEGDTESYEEALWIISKLKIKLGAQESVVRISEKEKITLDESGEKVSRTEVVDAFKQLTGKGTDPADLDESDPEVADAQQLLERWSTQQESEPDEDHLLRYNFEKTMLFVDAGFHDPTYLREVLGWLFQDSTDVPKDTDNPTRVALRNDMANAVRKIRELLGQIK